MEAADGVADGGGVGVCFTSGATVLDVAPAEGAGSAWIEPKDFTSMFCGSDGTFAGEDDSGSGESPMEPKFNGATVCVGVNCLGMVTLSLLGALGPRVLGLREWKEVRDPGAPLIPEGCGRSVGVLEPLPTGLLGALAAAAGNTGGPFDHDETRDWDD